MELGLNLKLFHVDVHHKLDDDGMSYCDRWIFAQLEDMFEAIESAAQAEKITISLQSRRCDNPDNEYSISTITKIIKGEDANGQVCYVFKCLNGKSYMQPCIDIQEDQILNPRVVYSLKS
ncbi:hypothetical protein [Geomobilimonas luticola]|uniref:hypothetical protein n=1 Tax=Geomobilimonas luticola TaxID=1114878 RepID=UPI001BDB0305|nr:hypothetical protein [Geomobilimonas luticola]